MVSQFLNFAVDNRSKQLFETVVRTWWGKSMHNVEKVHVKDRLIEAAGEMFALCGYRAATVREICRKAGTHVGAVNYHFRDKEGLFTAVLEHAHQWSVRRYPPDAGLKDGAVPEEKLRVFVSSFLRRVLGQGAPDWHGRLMIREMAEPSEALNRMVRSSIHPLYLYLVSILRELLSEDRSATDEVNETAFLCAMSITGQFCSTSPDATSSQLFVPRDSIPTTSSG
jgi:TetR/AcrR family transcriptional regulator, regulator of cefoperazone and chloramphenicol sensitivity